jgi:DNA polymerase elongation subunit (family B)
MARLSPGSAISYMECVEALRRGRHVRWKKNLPEAWKSAVELSVSDRGGHIFDPVVGAFSEVVEMDFSSFYPHIMWRKNLSVETLNCPCCPPTPDNTVPALGYHVCTRQEGLISAVVGRILTERMRAKDLSKVARTCELRFPEESGMGDLVPRNGRDRYRSISTILKWVLVTCFGYTGYRNARFGKIEAHESITAYAREYLLRAREVVEGMGFRLLHGIVDSMWVQGPLGRAQEAAGAAIDATGIPIDVEAVYRWIVFLPNKTNGAGALTKYFGLRGDGEVKMRGIETRQHSTPHFIKTVQEETISALSGAKDASELPWMMGEVSRVLARRGAELKDRRVDPLDLALTMRVSRELDGYSTSSEQVCALRLLREEGVEVPPGQRVRFVVLDHSARRPAERVSLLRDGLGRTYDVDRYLRLTARAVGNIMSLFGLDEGAALRALKGEDQRSIRDYERD